MAMIAFRSAVRSRLVLTLLVVLLATLVGMPLTIKGDGTLAGRLGIMLYYTLGLAAAILSVATIWAACGAVSLEIDDKSIHLVAVKPVRRMEIWAGKWLGLMAMNLMLLAVVGAVTWSMIMIALSRSGVTDKEKETVRNEILVGRTQLLSMPESLAEEAAKRFDVLSKAGKIPRDKSKDEALSLVQRQVAIEHSVIQPGTVKKWVFDTAKLGRVDPDAVVSIRIRFFRLTTNWGKIAGNWRVGPEDNPGAFKASIGDFPGNTFKLSVPGSAVPAGKKVVVTFENAESSRSNAVGFDRATGVEMLVKRSSFTANLVRALLVILCYMGFLAALGITCGSMFSFPVASFVAAAALVIVALSNYFVTHMPIDAEHGHEHGHGGAMHTPAVLRFFIARINDAVSPVLEFTPLTNLADGIVVSWWTVAKALIVLVAIYGGMLAVIGGYALRRKELALPD